MVREPTISSHGEGRGRARPLAQASESSKIERSATPCRPYLRSNRSPVMAQRTTPPFRADHVGSFLRPPELLDARERFQQGALSREGLRAVEDAAIREIVRFQEDVGLQAATDGEFRRTYFHVDFLEQLAGVEIH